MDAEFVTVERQINISPEYADRLSHLARTKAISEDQVIERALGILFNLVEMLDESTERQGWSLNSAAVLARVWNNEDDAAYDNWRELYGVPAR